MSHDSREAFEKDWCSAGWVLGPFDDTDGRYMYPSTEWGRIGWQAAQSRHAAEREALVRKCARYEELIREVIATDEAAVKELEAMNLGGVAEPTLTAKLRHALFDSGSQG
jgi:hypothetical protein